MTVDPPEDPSAPRTGPRRPGRPGPSRPPRPAAGPPTPSASPDAGFAQDPGPAPAPRRERRPRPDEDEYFDLPNESRIPRWLVALGVVVVVIALIGGGAMYWYRSQVDPSGPQGEAVEVQIPEGATTSKVASILDDEGVITSATMFNFYVGGKDLTAVQAGTYEFRLNSSFDQAIEVLNAGPAQPLARDVTKVTIPEGYTVDQIIEKISTTIPRFTKEDLQAAIDGGLVPSALKPADQTSYEGLLFPATYEVDDDDTALDLLTMMSQEMESRVEALNIEQSAADISQKWGIEVDAYDLLTVASLIQEEAGNPDEAPKIATVIYNRLRDGWALGIDATSQYLARIEGGEIDFESESPYNTRRQTGLPPTPIAAPGEYALSGAMNPADGPWMYYVLTDPGVHTFAVTDAEFAAAKQICIEKDLGCA